MAVIGRRTFRLKDGRQAIIRSGEERDAVDLIEVAQSLLSDGVGFVIEPDEFKMTEEQERAWVRNMVESPNEILLLVECDGLIIGILDFHANKPRRMSHVGYFGMGVRKNWRGLGVGRILMETLKDWALSTGHIEKINLRVLANNPRAIELFLSLGFREDGRKTRDIKRPDGTYVDAISMELLLR